MKIETAEKTTSTSRRRLALGCSVMVHAAVLAMAMIAQRQPGQFPKPAAQSIAVVFETPQQVAEPQRQTHPDLTLPAGTPASPLQPAIAKSTPPPEPPAIPAVEPALLSPPLLAPSSVAPAAAPPVPSLAETSRPAELASAAALPTAPAIVPVPHPLYQDPKPATQPPVPSRPVRPRSRPEAAARPAPASRRTAPPVITRETLQQSASVSRRSQQDAPVDAPPAAPVQSQISRSWQSALVAWLQSHRTYPDQARRRSEEGTVLVRFSVARDGHVFDVMLVRSSGSPTLDEAAQATFRDARIPPFTADMSQAQTTITVPIHYRLER